MHKGSVPEFIIRQFYKINTVKLTQVICQTHLSGQRNGVTNVTNYYHFHVYYGVNTLLTEPGYMPNRRLVLSHS